MDESVQLSHEEAQRLILEAQAGSTEAADRLVECNLALVRSIVKRFTNRGCEYDDLFQIGCIGLVKAIRHFDMSFGVRFSTYAVPMIAGEIKRHLRDDGAIRVSRSLRELAAKASAAREAFLREYGREPGIAEIAKAVNASPEELAQALEAALPCVSIYEPVYGAESDALLMDVIPSGAEEINTTLERVVLKELLSQLSPRERSIIVMRYFLDKTQSETAKALGISQVQVSRLESKILMQLRSRAGA